MKKAGRVDLPSSARKQQPISMSRSQSTGQIQRPAPTTTDNRRKEEQKMKGSASAQRLPTKAGANASGGDSAVQKPAYPKAESGPTSHRLSLDGNLAAAGYFQAPPSSLQSQANSGRIAKQPVASSRELLQFVRSQHPSATDGRKLVRSPTDVESSSGRKMEKSPSSHPGSSQHAQRSPGSQSLTSLPQTSPSKIVSKLSFRTRTGSVGGVPKTHNQDNFLLVNDFAGCKNQCLFGVFDGHGVSGHEVSTFVKKLLPTIFDSHIPKQVKTAISPLAADEEVRHFRTAFTSTFLEINSELLKRLTIDTSFSGTTAVTVLLRGNLAICANAGDSRAVLGRKTESSWSAVALSNDHKPDEGRERERILRAGGRVEPFKGENHTDESGEPQGPPRVWLHDEEIPGLAMSRSIGDFVAAQVGVTSEPETMHVELGKEHKFLIIASDGIWEFISSQTVSCRQCVEMIAPFWETGNIDGACEKIVREAVAYWKRVFPSQEDDSIDDITLILAFLAL